jgi:hypothetical protein
MVKHNSKQNINNIGVGSSHALTLKENLTGVTDNEINTSTSARNKIKNSTGNL